MNFKYDLQSEFSETAIQEAFNTIDIHKNGFLTFEELSLFLDILEIKADDKQIEEMIRMADANLMGKVSFEEFRQMSKGELLSPIGIALPPTPALLEGNEITWMTKGISEVRATPKRKSEHIRKANQGEINKEFEMPAKGNDQMPDKEQEKEIKEEAKKRKSLVSKFFHLVNFEFERVFNYMESKKKMCFREIDYKLFLSILNLRDEYK